MAATFSTSSINCYDYEESPRKNKYAWAVPWVGAAFSVATFAMLCVVVGRVDSTAKEGMASISDLKASLDDSAGTVAELRGILPQLKQSLDVLQRLCSTDLLRRYCTTQQ